MKKLFGTLIFLATIFISCQEKNNYILTEEKFVDILVDIHIADAFYSNNQYGELKLAEIDSTVFYKAIFEKHGVEKERFDSTLKAYTLKPAEMETIYDQVIDKLKKIEAEQQKQEEQTIKENSK